MRLHHYGIVCKDVAVGQALYEQAFGGQLVGQVYDDPIQKAKISFLAVAGNSALVELIAPYAADAPVANFLAKTGGGLHHTCYMVPDLDAALTKFRQSKALPVFGPEPAVAFDRRRIAFVYLRDRTLVELVEADPALEPGAILRGV